MTSASTTSSSSGPRKILVRAPTWVGDLMMATPALRALRRAHPDAEILMAGRPVFQDLVGGIPSVDRFMPETWRGAAQLVSYSRLLRRERCDWAVLLPDSVTAVLAPFLARIPVRAGYARDPLRRVLLTRPLAPPQQDGERIPISMIERYLRVTRALDCPDAGLDLDLVVDPQARGRVATRLAEAGLNETARIVVVTPGAAFGASKLWPAEHFATACDGMAKDLGLHTVLAPGPGEEDVARSIAERMSTSPLLFTEPVSTLPELAALIERAAVLLSNDTGPRHMAVALGIPAVTVMGPTDPRHTEHLMERQRVLREPVDCSPCHLKVCPIDHRCMTRLEPDRAVAAAAELLS